VAADLATEIATAAGGGAAPSPAAAIVTAAATAAVTVDAGAVPHPTGQCLGAVRSPDHLRRGGGAPALDRGRTKDAREMI